MKIEFRLPGTVEYGYASVFTTEGSPADQKRELRDLDADFWNLVGNSLSEGCSMTALGPLQGRVIQETAPDPAPAYNAPPWASEAPQEGQGYNYQSQAPQAPQGPPQGSPAVYQTSPQQYQGYQAPQATFQQPNQAPPGQQAPVCNHGVPMKFFAGGVSTKTNKPYGTSYRCQANVPREQQCKAVWAD